MRLAVTPLLYTPSGFIPSERVWSFTALNSSCVIMNIYAALQIHKCTDIRYGNRHVRWKATFDSVTVG